MKSPVGRRFFCFSKRTPAGLNVYIIQNRGSNKILRWPFTLASAPFPAGPPARPRARIPAVHRRDFLLGSALGMAGMLTGRAWADHHTVSASPLMVEFDLASATSRYTPVADFFVRDHADEPSLFGAPSGLHLLDHGVHRWLSLDALR